MEKNFNLLFERVKDTLEKSELEKIREQLNSIKGNTLITGVGGSSVVANFASKVLDTKGINVLKSPRDIICTDTSMFDNILIASYSGKGYVVENLLGQNKKIFLLTNADVDYDNVSVIRYDNTIKSEHSFISLASTLMPISILYYYYNPTRLPMLIEEIEEMFERIKQDIEYGNLHIKHNRVYEILGGNEFSTAIKYLESTLVESGIAIPIVHEKSNYCHGRTTTSYQNNNGLIYFDSEKEFDDLIKKNLKDYYSEISIIEKYYKNDKSDIGNDFYATIKSMYLTKMLAENKGKDLSHVDYSPFVKKIYSYKGEM